MGSILVLLEKRYYKPYGGAELATTRILSLLVKEGFDVFVVTGNKIFKTDGIKYVYSQLLDIPSKVHLWINLYKISKSWLDKFLKKFDTVYIPRLAYPLIPLAKKYGKKVVVHLHDYQPITYSSVFYPNESYSVNLLKDMRKSLQFEILENENTWRALLSLSATPLNRLNRLWLSKADAIICVSKRQREIIGSVAPELEDKLRVIYNPLPEVNLAEKKLKKPTFMYVGGDSYIKGFHIFLRASNNLLKQNSDMNFLVVGKLKNQYSKAVIELLNKKFRGVYHLFGDLPHNEVMKLYSISYAFIFSSITEEPFPYSIVEAMMTGTLPIASRVGGISEIIEGTLAEKFLFEPGNALELTDNIKNLLSLSASTLVDIGIRLRETIQKKFDEGEIKKKLIKIFN
jgi:glycosyltransferase involved in cell wall biosynthesis